LPPMVVPSFADMTRRERLESARLYLVCDRRPRAFLDAALRGGVDIVQLRDKEASDRELLAAARDFRAACDRHDALFVLNDRPDLVLAARADGVHVGQDDMPVGQARALVGADRLIGLSTHTLAQVDAAAGVDYLGVGPVAATPTKPGRPAVGVGLVRHAAAAAAVPFFPIGGIDVGLAGAVARAGATRIAVVRAIAESADPEAAARALRAALEAPVGAA
jgi:thiamine-phosphate pyrophosphorylase